MDREYHARLRREQAARQPVSAMQTIKDEIDKFKKGMCAPSRWYVRNYHSKHLTTFSRGAAKMETFVADFQIKTEPIESLGKQIDEDMLGTMLLNQSNVSDLGRKLITASTNRSVADNSVLSAMRLHFVTEDAKGDVFDVVVVGGGGVDTQ